MDPSGKIYNTRPPDPTCNVRAVPLEALHAIWGDSGAGLDWQCLFILPSWLTSWWSVFGDGREAHAIVAEDRDGMVGLAPLMTRGSSASFIGSPDVCDYLDVVIAPKRQSAFVGPLLEYLEKRGIRKLSVTGLRKDAVVWTNLIELAGKYNWEVVWEKEDVTFEVELPQNWDAFLHQLKGKQRHELRRKLRRVHEAGEVRFRLVENPADMVDAFHIFIDLFRASRSDKAQFMTVQMAAFFHALTKNFSEQGILKLGILDLSGKAVSAVMCFDYRSTRYLYNSGYDPRFRALSAGLICKVLSIKDAINRGLLRFDFLKGAEAYKHRLGGKSKDLFRCEIRMR